MDPFLAGLVIGTFVLVIATFRLAARRRRQRRRDELMRNLDHHEWYHGPRSRRRRGATR